MVVNEQFVNGRHQIDCKLQKTLLFAPKIMLAPRSSARLAAQASSAARSVEPIRKRRPDTTLTRENVKKICLEETVLVAGRQAVSSQIARHSDADEDTNMVPAVLTFDFELAKEHLISVDHRFQELFNKMTCKPFEHLEQVHPFRCGRFSCCNLRLISLDY